MSEIVALLNAYLQSVTDIEDCAEWCAGFDWNDTGSTVELKETVGILELLVTDIANGLRDEEELRAWAVEFLDYVPETTVDNDRTPSLI